MPKASRKELRKALFKKGADARDEAKQDSKSKHESIEAAKPVKTPTPKRYILFVGNLPYDVTEQEIKDHFKNCKISSLRLRQNGICFLEFAGDDAAAQLHHALQFHHSNLRKRKINVEFSAGGGGNSSRRREKITKKNKDFQDELKDKQKTPETQAKHKSFTTAKDLPPVDQAEAASSGINPARLAALRSRK